LTHPGFVLAAFLDAFDFKLSFVVATVFDDDLHAVLLTTLDFVSFAVPSRSRILLSGCITSGLCPELVSGLSLGSRVRIQLLKFVSLV
jgi:hypothetical protein